MPSTTLYVDVAVPIHLNRITDTRYEVRFGRFMHLAGWIETDWTENEDDESWHGVLGALGDEVVTDPVPHHREAARLLVLEVLGGRRPPES